MQKEFLQKLIFTLNWTLSLQRLTNFTSVILNWIFKQNKKKHIQSRLFAGNYKMFSVIYNKSNCVVEGWLFYFVKHNFVAFNQI